MNDANASIPVALFAYARPVHLARVLACLRENGVTRIHAFADGAKGAIDAEAVAATRGRLRAIDWAEVRLVERTKNLGLGSNILAGASEVAAEHEAFIVWEDDLICVPGAYAWICAALRAYAQDERVMSVTGWGHPRIAPATVGDGPYFDRRPGTWVWGTWRRAWQGTTEATAREKMVAAARRGFAPDAYGADLPMQVRDERRRNIWAVRWAYHHFERDGLCVRPPWSLVEHIGFDASGTNAGAAGAWANPPLRPAPAPPAVWPVPEEHPECQQRWRAAEPGGWRLWVRRVRAKIFSMLRRRGRYAAVAAGKS